MPTHILVNGLGLTYKGTIGLSTATIPDVCKTPSPGGPVPIPYPNIATQSSLKKGTKTVKAKGKMIAVKGSQYGSSNGDEAGTAGGVKSSVNMKATDWITYSFDVKMDGKNACRHTDKKFHNDKNTGDLCGNVDCLIPEGYSGKAYKHADDCEALHAEYKANQKRAREHRKDERAALKTKINDGIATSLEETAMIDIEQQRVEFMVKELEGRSKYVLNGCDEVEWKGTNYPGDPGERRRRHNKAIEGLAGQIKNTLNFKVLI